MFSRSGGVFLNISSLPSEFGIGDFGVGSFRFIEALSRMGMKWWQILPLCPVDDSNSPYSSTSAFAINPYYVDLKQLNERGLLSSDDIEESKYHGTPYSVDYEFVSKTKNDFLRRAFNNFNFDELSDFRQKNKHWLEDYAKFMAYKKSNNFQAWWKWENEFNQDDVRYYIFEQYIMYTQWEKVKSYANQSGISILGDMPIYVSRDSADFWSNKESFYADSEGNLCKVSGIPPDYFAVDGQLWGNPLYNWDIMKKDGYSWWINRIGKSLELYDSVRIDHFIGFYKYWSVDAKAVTAKDGTWESGPGIELFEAVNKAFPNPQIIAEDLGIYGEDLIKFVKDTGYPGMRVMQFAFSGYDSVHLPHKYNEKTIAYTGTHDNDTMLGWLWAASNDERSKLLEYCRFDDANWGEGGERSKVIRSIITTLWQSSALISIVPIQDICGFGTDTRMNIPGDANGHWRFRITDDSIRNIDYLFYSQLSKTYGR